MTTCCRRGTILEATGDNQPGWVIKHGVTPLRKMWPSGRCLALCQGTRGWMASLTRAMLKIVLLGPRVHRRNDIYVTGNITHFLRADHLRCI